MKNSKKTFAIRLATLTLAVSPTFAYAEPPSAAAKNEGSIAYWVTQLGSDQYLRRETAVKKLADEGPAAIEELLLVMRSGDLEVVERAAEVMTEIAIVNKPSDDGGAWKSLTQLASDSVGRASSRAQAAVEEIRKHRSAQARTELSAAGVFVGLDEFVIRAISQPRMMVQIDEKWNGNVETLQWLAWLDGVENARVKGPAINAEVMSRITKLPKLESLAIVDGTIDEAVLQPLSEMKPINTLEFRYTRLTDDQGDKIAALPVRVALNLMGTGISAQRIDSMREASPGLQIDHRQGGFLGVTCQDTFDACEISGVVPKSAAEEAGLIRGDVIVQLDDTKVTRFRDLQDAINLHVPEDAVRIKYLRAEKMNTTEVKLRRFED